MEQHPSELAELCWNLVELHQLENQERHACRKWHPHRLSMGGQTVARRIHCHSQLEVMAIRARNERACRKHHLWD